jgi:hypothetical protein
MKGGEFFFAPSLSFLRNLKKKDNDWEVLSLSKSLVQEGRSKEAPRQKEYCFYSKLLNLF